MGRKATKPETIELNRQSNLEIERQCISNHLEGLFDIKNILQNCINELGRTSPYSISEDIRIYLYNKLLETDDEIINSIPEKLANAKKESL